MKWIGLLLLGAAACIVSAETEITKLNCLEGSEVQVPCGEYTGIYEWKAWVNGFYDEDVIITDESAYIYRIGTDGSVDPDNTDSKTKVDTSTFDLIVSNIQLDEHFNYTCRYMYKKGLVWLYNDTSRTTLSPYIQPGVPTCSTTPTDLSNLEEGDPLTVTCIIDHLYPTITETNFMMTWGGDNVCPGAAGCTFTPTAIPGDLAMQYTLDFTKTLAKHDDEALITCTIDPEIGRNKTASIPRLQVKYGPQKKPSLTVDNDNPYQYTNVTFTCGVEDIEANPEINEVKWKIGNTEKGHDGKELVITDVRTTDSGQYKCIVRNGIGSGKESDSKTLNVRDEYAPQNRPELKIDKDYTHQYENVTFTCNTSGVNANPHVVRFIWTKDGVDQPETVLEFTRTVMHEDTGGYMCSVGNGIGNPQLSAFVKLNVSKKYGPRFPPTLSVSNKTPHRYDNVTFICDYGSVDADPGIDKIEWTKDGQPFLDWLGAAAKTIYHVNGQNNGTYSCSVGNGICSRLSEFLTFTINSLHMPHGVVKMSAKPNHAKLNESVIFNCNIDGMQANPPEVNVTWMKNDVILSDWPTLCFKHQVSASKSDNGTYKCIVDNSIGNLTSNDVKFTASKFYHPRDKPVLSVDNPTSLEGEEVEFKCKMDGIDAHPKPHVVWYKNGNEIDWKNEIAKQVVNVDDSGNYTCCAENFVGTSPPSDIVVVQVKGNGGGSSSTGIIIGVVVSVAVVVVAVIGVVLFMRRRQFLESTNGDVQREGHVHENSAFEDASVAYHTYEEVREKTQDVPDIGSVLAHGAVGDYLHPNDMTGDAVEQRISSEYLEVQDPSEHAQEARDRVPEDQPSAGVYENLHTTEGGYQKLIFSRPPV